MLGSCPCFGIFRDVAGAKWEQIVRVASDTSQRQQFVVRPWLSPTSRPSLVTRAYYRRWCATGRHAWRCLNLSTAETTSSSAETRVPRGWRRGNGATSSRPDNGEPNPSGTDRTTLLGAVTGMKDFADMAHRCSQELPPHCTGPRRSVLLNTWRDGHFIRPLGWHRACRRGLKRTSAA